MTAAHCRYCSSFNKHAARLLTDLPATSRRVVRDMARHLIVPRPLNVAIIMTFSRCSSPRRRLPRSPLAPVWILTMPRTPPNNAAGALALVFLRCGCQLTRANAAPALFCRGDVSNARARLLCAAAAYKTSLVSQRSVAVFSRLTAAAICYPPTRRLFNMVCCARMMLCVSFVWMGSLFGWTFDVRWISVLRGVSSVWSFDMFWISDWSCLEYSRSRMNEPSQFVDSVRGGAGMGMANSAAAGMAAVSPTSAACRHSSPPYPCHIACLTSLT